MIKKHNNIPAEGYLGYLGHSGGWQLNMGQTRGWRVCCRDSDRFIYLPQVHVLFCFSCFCSRFRCQTPKKKRNKTLWRKDWKFARCFFTPMFEKWERRHVLVARLGKSLSRSFIRALKKKKAHWNVKWSENHSHIPLSPLNSLILPNQPLFNYCALPIVRR